LNKLKLYDSNNYQFFSMIYCSKLAIYVDKIYSFVSRFVASNSCCYFQCHLCS